MAYQQYEIEINYSSPQLINPLPNCLDKSIFKTTNRNRLSLDYKPRGNNGAVYNVLEEKLTEKIIQKASFEDIWEDIKTEANFEPRESRQSCAKAKADFDKV